MERLILSRRFLSRVVQFCIAFSSCVAWSSELVTIRTCCSRPKRCPDTCHTIYIPRSPHINNAYWVARPRISRCARELREGYVCNDGCTPLREFVRDEPLIGNEFSVGFTHQHSFASVDLATCLFGRTELVFAGSAVQNRPDDALLADQFGLSPTYQGIAKLAPMIENNSIHFEGACILGSTQSRHQFFVRGLATVTHETRSLFESDTTCQSPFETVTIGDPFPAGARAVASVPAAPSLEAALSGTFATGDMKTPWCGARLTPGKLSATNLSGCTFDLGYASPLYEVYRYLVYARYRVPTGTHINGSQRHGCSFFAPVVGDGAHTELGAGFTIVREFWRDDAGRALSFRCDGYGTHLLRNRQRRTFDLKDHGCLSRNLLLKKIDPITGIYDGEIVSATCFTTRDVYSTVGGSGEVTLQFLMRTPSTAIGIGYEFFGRTAERVCLRSSPTTARAPYGIQGCTGVYGFGYSINGVAQTITVPPASIPLPVQATASNATIVSCGSVDSAAAIVGAPVVVAWNNQYVGSGDPANAVPDGTPVVDVEVAVGSQPPVFLTDQDLDLCSGAAPKQVVHKGFITFTHQWSEVCGQPYVMVGASGEGSGEVCSLKQWGFWLQTGCAW